MLGFSPLASRPIAGDFTVTSAVVMDSDGGYYNLTGQDAAMRVTTHRMNVAAGYYSLTGKDASVIVGLPIQIGDVARLSGVLATVELKGLVS